MRVCDLLFMCICSGGTVEWFNHVFSPILIPIGLAMTEYAFVFITCIQWVLTLLMFTVYRQDFFQSSRRRSTWSD